MSSFEQSGRPVPRARALSNGKLTAIVTEAGGGCSLLAGLALTRWTPDPARPADGPQLYVRDLDSGESWPLAQLAGAREPDAFEAALQPGCVTISRADGELRTTLEVCVSPSDDIELRRIGIRNRGDRPRRLDVTTYAELVLNAPAADAAHPAFSKLFVQTEHLADSGGILAWRRPRAPEEEPVFAVHLLRPIGDAGAGGLELETDRMRFLGRGRALAAPAALDPGAALSGTTGPVLDPVAALRRTLVVGPGARAQLLAVTGAAASREAAIALARHYSLPGVGDHDFRAACERARVLLQRLGLPHWEEAISTLTGALVFGDSATAADRPDAGTIQAGGVLRRLGLGAAPLVVARSADTGVAHAAIDLARYFRAQALPVDLLVLAPDEASAVELRKHARAPVPRDLGRTVVVVAAELPPAADAFARGTARFVLERAPEASRTPPSPAAAASERVRSAPPGVGAPTSAAPADSLEPLRFFNGHGGFSADGSEYVIRMPPGGRGPDLPPLPWTHVVANEEAGFIVSERGAGYTWSVNSRENRLTPWFNDPVSDPHGEALYLRDDDDGAFWSPTPGPVPAAAPYEARWGFGQATWRTTVSGIVQEVTAFVPRRGPLRITRVRLHNLSGRRRRLSLYSYAQWVLGTLPYGNAFLGARVDPAGGAVLAVNPANGEFGGRVAFAAALAGSGAAVQATANRIAFLGGRADVSDPAAVRDGGALDAQPGFGPDACAARRVSLVLEPGEETACAFLLGQAPDEAGARAALAHFGSPGAVDAALAEVCGFWAELTGRLRVETPAPALDLMVNGWLVYQDLCCRIWARSAFYQSGGAFGFRDQLQDAAALVYLDPSLTRDQILLHAAHQFPEGDVLHWWHPPSSKGIRTRFADDLLWLPYIAAFYVVTTGDAGVLEEGVRYLRARALEPGEDEAFLLPEDAGESGTVYDHCCRALDRSLTVGPHGLPLIGTGDWNDGMNRVGREGRGESVWLGFFLYDILGSFLPICAARGDTARAGRYGRYREELRAALNGAGWDGAWYRRAYYDDGAPLGSASSDECRIDAIAQAWAVLSGAAPPARAAQALDALERHLVREGDGLIALLTPPFDRTPHDPGYIKGYLPGVRENGGQYTHGALWAVRALAEAGRHERAAALLELLSPVSHARTPEAVEVYRAEPYVIGADVYGVVPHVGRAGWTWYTGSAGWMLRVALESVLGLTLEGGRTLRLRPCIPASWPGFDIHYRLPGDAGVCDIRVTRGTGATQAALGGVRMEVEDGAVVAPLPPDGAHHELRVVLGDDVGPVYRER